MIDEGPFTAEVSRMSNKIIKRKVITYEEVDGAIKITTSNRRYYNSGDYHDDLTTEILYLNK